MTGHWQKRSFMSLQLRRKMALAGFAAIIVAGCSAPGSTATPAPTAAPPTTVATVVGTPVATPTVKAPDCGTAPVVVSVYAETISELMPKLSEEFTKQYPNVTFDIKLDTFANGTANLPRLLASDNPPDIARSAMIIDLAKDNLLKNLDPYAAAYGWDKWPQAQFEQVRVDASFKRGSGSLRAFGLNQSTVGVFYNKKLAAQIGMTAAPKTVEEFDALLAKAKEAGLQPIMQWNASTSGGGLAFPLQNLMAAYGDITPLKDWIYQKSGATIDTAGNLKATQKLAEWIQKGYFPKDVNATEYTDAAGRFGKGEGVFTFNGDWQNAGYDKDLPGNVGFFTFPNAVGMSAPLTFVIGEKSKHADCAAFFFNWVLTNDKARAIDVAVGGSNPGGPADATVPAVSADSVTAQTLAAGAAVTANSGGMDFIANATSSVFFQSWTPELQKLVGAKTTPEQLLKDVQAFYVTETSK
jgi:raffinose/stachyose/melibiose transport system substrate-binding protein